MSYDFNGQLVIYSKKGHNNLQSFYFFLAMSSKRRQSEYAMDIDVREQQWQSDTSTTFLEHLCGLNIDVNPGAIRQTSIICTIGKSGGFRFVFRVLEQP